MNPKLSDDDRYLDAKRLCERVCISKGTLKTWKGLGLPFYSVQGKHLFHFREVKDWLNNYRTIEADLDQVANEAVKDLR